MPRSMLHFSPGTKVKSNFISTIGYGDPATIFERSPRPGFDRFNKHRLIASARPCEG